MKTLLFWCVLLYVSLFLKFKGSSEKMTSISKNREELKICWKETQIWMLRYSYAWKGLSFKWEEGSVMVEVKGDPFIPTNNGKL